MSMIHLAAKAGHTTAIRYLLENQRLSVNAKVVMNYIKRINLSEVFGVWADKG